MTTNHGMIPPSVPENEARVKWLTERLLKAEIGEVVTYEDLEQVAGCDITGRFRFLLYRARKRLRRDHQILFTAVKLEGLRRCDDSGVVDQGTRRLHVIRRQAKRGTEDLSCVRRFEGLAPEERNRMLMVGSYFCVISAATRHDRQKQIEARMAERQKELPWKEMLQGLRETI